MAAIKAKLPGTAAPLDGQDYGTHDSRLGIGGYVELDDVAMRDAIIPDRLRVGMLVYCVFEDKTFRLTSLSPKTWTEAAGGGGGPSLVDVNTTDIFITLGDIAWQVLINEHDGAPVAVSMPAPAVGRRVEVADGIDKADSSAPITLDGGGALIDGDAQLTIDLAGAWVQLVSDGTNWRIA